MSFEHASLLWFLLPLVLYVYRSKHAFVQTLRYWALALLIIALSQPLIKGKSIEQEMPSHSLIIALDLSASMKAEDISPNRMFASKEIIKTFLQSNQSNQIALLGFTINPLLLSPPTQDHVLVARALESIKSDYILTKGTDLKKLLNKVAQFSESEKLLLLFSDGGDEPIEEELIAFAQEEEIKILAIGMATLQGATIRLKDSSLLQDKKGHLVVSKLNEGLEHLATESAGEFISFSSPASTAEEIASWVEKQAMDKSMKYQQSNNQELFWIPSFLALILLFISATRLSLKLVALLLFLGVNVQAKVNISREQWESNLSQSKGLENHSKGSWLDDYYLHKAYIYYKQGDYKSSLEAVKEIEEVTLESQLTLAHIYYKQEQYKKAKSILKGLKTKNRSIKQQLFYELGNCEAQENYYEKAKNYYVKALQLGEDADALHNLEVVIFLKQKYDSTLGVSNASSAQASKSTEATESRAKANSKQEKVGSSGGSGAKVGKQSTVKIVKSDSQSKSKREMSSKAYDIINKGYIKEKQPW